MTPPSQTRSGDTPASDTVTGPDHAVGTLAQIRGTVAAYGVRIFLAAVMGVVVSRALEPAGRGSYSVIVTIATVATVLGHLSIGQANVSFWSVHSRSIPATDVLIGPPLGLLAAGLIGLAVMGMGSGIVPVSDPWLLMAALIAVPAAVMVVHLTVVTLLLGRLDIVNRSLTIAAAVQCAAFIALAWAGRLSTSAVVWTWVATSILPLAFLLPTVSPHLGRPDVGLARRMIADGAQYHVGVFALFLLLRVDVLLLNALTTAAQVGLYTLAVSVGEMAYAGTDALAQAMLRRQAEAGLQDSATLAVRTTRVAVCVALASVLALCVVAPVLVPLLYGAAFRASVPALWALAPGLVAYSATQALSPYLLRLGRPRVMSSLSVLALTGNVGLNLLLIPLWGIAGSAIATSTGYVLLAICRVAWFCRASGLPAAALVPRGADVALILEAGRQPFGRKPSVGHKA